MFATLGSFSVVYFALAGVLFILILFEKYFIAFEDKYRKRARNKRKQRKVQSNGNTKCHKSV